ncbi:MAG: P-II family nitrogen regulator [Burkholderiales bacterium]|nr:P-II family nitrogen regulator [Burkholderiales bacterium]
MDFKLIIAIIRVDKLEEVEKKLREIGVERINVSKVKGYGEYQDFFARNWMVEEVRLEVFTRQDEVEAISAAIMEAAHTGLPGDGVVAVVPIEKLFLVRTKSVAVPGEFWPPN